MSSRLLVFEFITGGGLLGKPMPQSLRREGEMMRNALLTDLAERPDIDVVVMRDSRCRVASEHCFAQWLDPDCAENTMAFYRRILQQVEVVWLIAPETDGALAQLAETARSIGKRVLLSDAATLKICASKYATYCALQRSGVNVIETFRCVDPLPERDGPWVVKPDDGAGSIGVALQANTRAAHQALCAASQCLRIAQPWYDGDVLSLSLICAGGAAALLAVNRQQAFLRDDQITIEALTVNALPRNSAHFTELGQRIAAALPGLWGYIGVDLIRCTDSVLRVLEINPRMTTSYCGLRRALDINVADQVLRLVNQRELPMIFCAKDEAVELNLSADYV
jgi:tyramine---L-glutamate ligase